MILHNSSQTSIFITQQWLYNSSYGCSPLSKRIGLIVNHYALSLCAVPCVPKLIETNVRCESGAVAVSWEQSKGAHYYTVLAQGSGGYESTHNSSETSFVFDHLLCGLSYTITVSASDHSCSSAESNAEQIDTGRFKISSKI